MPSKASKCLILFYLVVTIIGSYGCSKKGSDDKENPPPPAAEPVDSPILNAGGDSLAKPTPPPEEPPPPTYAPNWLQTIDETVNVDIDTIISGSVTATDANDTVVNYSIKADEMTCDDGNWTVAPGVDAVSGALQGTPSSDDLGICTIKIQASSEGDSIETLVVISVNSPTAVAPDAINNLSTAALRTDEIEVSWTAPNDNGSAIVGYTIEYKENTASEWISLGNQVYADTNATISDLTHSTAYTFRIRAFNGAYSAYSNELVATTLIDDSFFQSGVFKAMNLGGATESQVVALEDNTTITLNDDETPIAVINKGETYNFTSAQNDILIADKPIFVAGRLGVAGASPDYKANIVWTTPDWAGSEFIFNTTRESPNLVIIHAFEDIDVEIYQGETLLEQASVTKGTNHIFSITGLSSFRMTSTGLMIAYTYASGSNTNKVVDPKPILPMSKDIIGFPSSSARLTSVSNANDYEAVHSSSTDVITGTLTAGVTVTLNPRGLSKLYSCSALRITGNDFIVANSYADSDGYSSAPFIPVSMMRKRYALNVEAEWVAFASTHPAEIRIIDPVDGSETTVTLTRTGTQANAPYEARLNITGAGFRFESDDRFAAWYQPNTDVSGSAEDESLMYGAD